MTFFVCGIDLIDLTEWQRVLDVGGDGFLEQSFTQQERQYCTHQHECYAARFAVKEAVVKALGSGFRDGVASGDIEVWNTSDGQPQVTLQGQALLEAQKLGIEHWSVSISYAASQVIAVAIATCNPNAVR